MGWYGTRLCSKNLLLSLGGRLRTRLRLKDFLMVSEARVTRYHLHARVHVLLSPLLCPSQQQPRYLKARSSWPSYRLQCCSCSSRPDHALHRPHTLAAVAAQALHVQGLPQLNYSAQGSIQCSNVLLGCVSAGTWVHQLGHMVAMRAAAHSNVSWVCLASPHTTYSVRDDNTKAFQCSWCSRSGSRPLPHLVLPLHAVSRSASSSVVPPCLALLPPPPHPTNLLPHCRWPTAPPRPSGYCWPTSTRV